MAKTIENKGFDFNQEIPVARWAIDNLVPMGHLVFIDAQAGVGKSLIIESMAVHIISDLPFCGMDTVSGDVLLIDEDTPCDTLKTRILRLQKSLNCTPKFRLDIRNMEGNSLKGISKIIAEYPNAKYIFIDSLNSTASGLDVNISKDMQVLTEIKKQSLTSDRVIIFTHHISEKLAECSVNDLMTMQTSKLAMGSSAINQQADTYFIVSAKALNGRMNVVYIRPVSKRQTISRKPFYLNMEETGDNLEVMKWGGYYETGLTTCEVDIIELHKTMLECLGVRQTVIKMDADYSESEIRTAYHNLEKMGKMIKERAGHNLYKYYLKESLDNGQLSKTTEGGK